MNVIMNLDELVKVCTEMEKGDIFTFSVHGSVIVELAESGFASVPSGQREHVVSVLNSINKYKKDREGLPVAKDGFFHHFARFVINYDPVSDIFYVMDGLGKMSSILFRKASEEKLFQKELLPILKNTVFQIEVHTGLDRGEMNTIMARLNVSGKAYGHAEMRNNMLDGNEAWEIVRDLVKDEDNADLLDMMGTQLPKGGTTVSAAPTAMTEVFYRAIGALTSNNKTECICQAYQTLAAQEDNGRRTLTRYANLMRAIGNYAYHLVSESSTTDTLAFSGYFAMRATGISKNTIKPKRHMMGCLVEALEKKFNGDEVAQILFLKNVADISPEKIQKLKGDIKKRVIEKEGLSEDYDLLGSSSCQMQNKHFFQMAYFFSLIDELQKM